mmetsp:Transcript_7557/g.10440  ORF Transcript_7557/g.10440 Transcript_7557/m.10440 type:complete len:421 (-) Transcript_7557:976-2238(-)
MTIRDFHTTTFNTNAISSRNLVVSATASVAALSFLFYSHLSPLPLHQAPRHPHSHAEEEVVMVVAQGDVALVTCGLFAGCVLSWVYVRWYSPMRRFNAKFAVPYDPKVDMGKMPDLAAAKRRLASSMPQATGKSYLVIGTGGVGVAFLEALWARGERNLAGFDLRPSRGRAGDGVRLITGDLTNPQDLIDACKGVDVVFHTAAAITYAHYHPNQWAFSERVNVVGTANVIAACKANKVGSLVYTSSSTVSMGKRHRDGNTQADEDMPLITDAEGALSHYMRSKAIAEASVVAANGVGGLCTACIRPTSAIIGPRDTYCIELMLKDMKGTAIGFENAFIDSVYVLNVVLGHMLLEEKLNDPSTTKLVSGQSFNISNNEPMCFLDLCRRLKWATNGGFVYDKLPPPIVTAVATVVGFLMGIG